MIAMCHTTGGDTKNYSLKLKSVAHKPAGSPHLRASQDLSRYFSVHFSREKVRPTGALSFLELNGCLDTINCAPLRRPIFWEAFGRLQGRAQVGRLPAISGAPASSLHSAIFGLWIWNRRGLFWASSTFQRSWELKSFFLECPKGEPEVHATI